MTTRLRRVGLVVAAVAVVSILAACTAGQVRSRLDAIDQKIEALDQGKAVAEQTVATLEPAIMLLPEEQRPKAEAALAQARAFLATYDQTRAAFVETRDELAEALKDAKDEDNATWATVSTIAGNAVSAIFSPGGLLTTGIALVTGIAGLFKGRKNAEKDAKTIVNAVDALRVREPAVAEAMAKNKDLFVTTLSPKAWELVEAERTT